MTTLEKLDALYDMADAEQIRGTEKLIEAGIEYDDGTVQGVMENIPTGQGGAGTIKLATTGYTEGNTVIENLGVPLMPFLAKVWYGGSDQITQGADGIALTGCGCIAMPFTGFDLPSWRVSITMRPTALAASAFSTFITLLGTSNNYECGVSYFKTTDRVYYAIGDTSTAEPLSADVVPGTFRCYEDNGFKSADITSGEFSIDMDGDDTYITAYLNGSPRIRLARAKISRSDNIELRVGCIFNRSDVRSFTGEVTALEIQ